MAKTRMIKKYPNRRLYDTELSKYVTLSHVRKLVLDGIDIKVVDAESEDDITRQIMMQIITEQESGESPLFSTRLLSQFIRIYRDAVPDVFGSFMEQNLDLYAKQQALYQKQMQNMLVEDPAKAFSRLTEQNLEFWKQMQEDFFKMAGVSKDGIKQKPDKD